MLEARDRRNATLAVSLVLTAVLLTHMVQLDRALKTEAAPRGIISFELAGSPQRAQTILDSWDVAAHAAARTSLSLDYAFLVAYAAALFLMCRMLGDARPVSRSKLRPVSRGLAWGQWIAAALDGTENVLLTRQLQGSREAWLAPTAATCASLKFIIVGLALLFITGAGLWITFRAVKGGGDATATL
jgi:hypothetical protein